MCHIEGVGIHLVLMVRLNKKSLFLRMDANI
jgi:hypothetical protein